MRSRGYLSLYLLVAAGCGGESSPSALSDAGDATIAQSDASTPEPFADAETEYDASSSSTELDASADIDAGAAISPDDAGSTADAHDMGDAGNDAGPAKEPTVATLAGAYADYCGETTDGKGHAARLQYSEDLAVTADGTVYFTELGGMRKVSPGGDVTTLAPVAGGQLLDGPLTSATLSNPGSLAIDGDGALWFSDTCTVRKLSPQGTVSTVAGATPLASDSTVCGFVDATKPRAAQFGYGALNPLAFDAAGNLYVLDVPNSAVRKLTPEGVVSTLAGGVTVPRGSLAMWTPRAAPRASTIHSTSQCSRMARCSWPTQGTGASARSRPAAT